MGQRSEDAAGAPAEDENSARRDALSSERSDRSNPRDSLEGAPRTLGKYRIVAQLGEGGAATVYLALTAGPAGVNKLLVLKVLKRQLASEPDFLRMFMDEARLSTRLNHPSIVQMIEVESADGRHFTVMEYLEGKPLSHVLGGRTPGITLNVIVHLIAESLGGFHYAHELADYDGTPLGVIHRDVSPQNLFVTYDGHAKLLDFGVAKMVWSNETEVGVMKGKPRYMAPEQICGGAIDRRADVFSAGVILWEAIVGKRMWAGMHDMAVLYAVSNGHIPSLREAAPSAPPELVRIVMKALAQDRDERHPTALALQEDLETYLQHTGEVISPRTIGRILTQHFSSDRAHIKTAIEAQLAVIASQPSLSDFRILSFQDRSPDLDRDSGLPPGPGMRGSRPEGAEIAATEGPSPSMNTSVTPSAMPAQGKGHRSALLVAIGLAGAAALGLTAWQRKGPEQPGAVAPVQTLSVQAPAQAPSAPPAPRLPSSASALGSGPASGSGSGSSQAPSAGTVTVTLLANPPEAHIFLDGKPLPSNPYVGHFPKDDAAHVLRAEAGGYNAHETKVTLASDGFFEATLHHNRGGVTNDPSSHSGGGRADDVTPESSASTAAAAPSGSSRPNQKKRAVDRNDPYAE